MQFQDQQYAQEHGELFFAAESRSAVRFPGEPVEAIE